MIKDELSHDSVDRNLSVKHVSFDGAHTSISNETTQTPANIFMINDGQAL